MGNEENNADSDFTEAMNTIGTRDHRRLCTTG
jgi:hypothetical protein